MPSLRAVGQDFWTQAELERLFWFYVETCPHPAPCRRCCWEWQGPRSTWNYGILSLPGFAMAAHRFAVEVAHGAGLLLSLDMTEVFYLKRALTRKKQSSFYVLHRCDNRPCVNPSHLFIGTAWDNTHDAISKQRLRHQAYATHTQCCQGHPYSLENTRIDPKSGRRHCRACERITSHRYRRSVARGH